MNTIINVAKDSENYFSLGPELVVNPSGVAPLAAALRFETSGPISAEITITAMAGAGQYQPRPSRRPAIRII